MSWFSWQIDYLLLLQNFRDFSNHIFDNFFLNVSSFGLTGITFILLFGIYWCYNKKIGTFMINCYAFSHLMNVFLKLTFCIYRPWIIDSSVKPVEAAFKTAPGYSFPSGHTAGATSCWGSCAASFWNNKLIRYSCLAIILLVMFSRNYLGVHTPQDVIVSFLVGIAIIFGFTKLFKWIEEKEINYSYYITAIALICLFVGSYIVLKNYPIDYVNGEILFDPSGIGFSNVPRVINLFLVMFGCYLERKFINFDPEEGTIVEKIIRLALGMYIFHLIETNLRAYLGSFLDHNVAKCIAYAICGIFLTFVYPLFIKAYQVAKIKFKKEV